jgi:glycosyltransferase involved in cell wall biosynthesis
MSQKPQSKSNQRKLRIAIDCHNLSTRHDKLLKTGIQQVVSNILQASLDYDDKACELVMLPWLPLSGAEAVYPDLKPTHVNNSPLVLEAIKSEFGTEKHEDIWGFDPTCQSSEASDKAFYEALCSCDWYIVTGLCEFRHAVHKAKQYNPALKVAVLVHDIVPITQPSLVAKGMPEWFFYSYVASIRQHADLLFCVSRHTAITCQQHIGKYVSRRLPIIATNLPGEIPETDGSVNSSSTGEFGLKPQSYFICLGTIEPRKNLILALKGFRSMKAKFSECKDLKLVFIGKKGWNNEFDYLSQYIDGFDDIVFTGFLDRVQMEALIKDSISLVMPSRSEGYGLPVSLANAYQRHVITCNNTSLPEVRCDYVDYVDPNNPDEIVLAFLNHWQSSKKPPKAIVASRLDWKALLASWVDTLEAESPVSLPRLNTSVQYRRKKILIDVHNLSIHSARWEKTGIQEVIYSLVKTVALNRRQFEQMGFEIILLPLLSEDGLFVNYGPSCFVTKKVLKEIEQELGLMSHEIWGFDLKSEGYYVGFETLQKVAKNADWMLFPAQYDCRRILRSLRLASPHIKISHVVHDIIPVLFPRKVDHKLKTWFRPEYIKSIQLNSDLVITVSRHAAQDFRDKFSKDIDDLVVISRRLPINQRRDDDDLPVEIESKPYLVIIGSTDPRKNVENMIYGFIRAKELSSSFKLSLKIIGPKVWRTKSLKLAQKVAEDKGCAIEELGYVSDNRLHELIAQSSGVMMASRYEGFGIPVALAKTYGKPIITCNNSSLPEVAQANGYFVTPSSIDEIACAILNMINQGVKGEERAVDSSDNWFQYLSDVLSILDVHRSGYAGVRSSYPNTIDVLDGQAFGGLMPPLDLCHN